MRRNVRQIAIPQTGTAAISQAAPVTVGNQLVESFVVSRDGQWLVYDSNLEGNQDLYIRSIEGGEPRRLTTNQADEFAPDLSWDGREVVFHSPRHGTRDVFLIAVDGTNEVRLTDLPEQEYFPTFSPDGLHVAFQVLGAGIGQIFVVSRDAVGEDWSAPRQLTHDGGDSPRWSPEGSQIAHATPNGIGVVSLDGDARLLLDSLAGLNNIENPVWSQDGRSIYFIAADSAGSKGLYVMSAAGGRPRLRVRFDDPSRPVWRVFSVSEGKLYVSIAEFESDIYVMDLEMR